MDFDFDIVVDNLGNLEGTELQTSVDSLNKTFEEAQFKGKLSIDSEGKLSYIDENGKAISGTPETIEALKNIDSDIKSKFNLFDDAKINKDGIDEAKDSKNLQKSTDNVNNLKGKILEDTWEGVKKLFKLGLVAGFALGALDIWANNKTGCYITQGGNKIKIFGKANKKSIGEKLCMCGTLISNTDGDPKNNLQVNQSCTKYANLTTDLCSTTNPAINYCALPKDSTTNKLSLGYKEYTIGDAIAGIAADAGYIIDEGGNIVKAGGSIIKDLLKYWWLILIILVVVLIFIAIVIHFLTR